MNQVLIETRNYQKNVVGIICTGYQYGFVDSLVWEANCYFNTVCKETHTTKQKKSSEADT